MHEKIVIESTISRHQRRCEVCGSQAEREGGFLLSVGKATLVLCDTHLHSFAAEWEMGVLADDAGELLRQMKEDWQASETRWLAEGT